MRKLIAFAKLDICVLKVPRQSGIIQYWLGLQPPNQVFLNFGVAHHFEPALSHRHIAAPGYRRAHMGLQHLQRYGYRSTGAEKTG